MFKTIQVIAAVAAALAIPCAMAQATVNSDQQVTTMKPVPKMTAEEKKADKAAKDKAAKDAKAAAKPAGATFGNTGQATQLAPPKKMTAEEKKADKDAKRKGISPEEQAKQAKQNPGG